MHRISTYVREHVPYLREYVRMVHYVRTYVHARVRTRAKYGHRYDYGHFDWPYVTTTAKREKSVVPQH